ncbi:hypothetical protein BGZ60DRAFT_426056 [Tricladium varicosporioides]|nr:hypothetical protein BGZ60DRAFT_426056 [Hymenoscyphus varicosporioides]
MADKTPVIQVLSRNNYEEQHLVPLPNALPLAKLPPSSLRVKTSIISLTTNNLSYARLGHLLGWWGVHPLPVSIPEKFSDTQKYGRISGWGYGVVTESTTTIEVGTSTYGYLPIGTLPVDLQVRVDEDVPGQFVEISKQRQKLLPIYNRYIFFPPNSAKIQSIEGLGIDSLFQVLFETSYLINRYVLAWEHNNLAHPSNKDDGWTFEDGQIGPNTIVLIFSPSGKTALSFAHQLKNGRPAANQPREIIGIGSDSSRAFTEQTGLYDRVLGYNDDNNNDSDLKAILALPADPKVIICDFGSRGGAGNRWADNLRVFVQNIVQIGVGGEVVADSPEVTLQKLKMSQTKTPQRKQVDASSVRTQAMEITGRKKYFEDFLQEWESVKENGFVKGVRLVWGESMEDVGKGWDRLCRGEVGPDEGLVYMLDGENKEKL